MDSELYLIHRENGTTLKRTFRSFEHMQKCVNELHRNEKVKVVKATRDQTIIWLLECMQERFPSDNAEDIQCNMQKDITNVINFIEKELK